MCCPFEIIACHCVLNHLNHTPRDPHKEINHPRAFLGKDANFFGDTYLWLGKFKPGRKKQRTLQHISFPPSFPFNFTKLPKGLIEHIYVCVCIRNRRRKTPCHTATKSYATQLFSLDVAGSSPVGASPGGYIAICIFRGLKKCFNFFKKILNFFFKESRPSTFSSK